MRTFVLPTAILVALTLSGCRGEPKTLEECRLRAIEKTSGSAISATYRICGRVFEQREQERLKNLQSTGHFRKVGFIDDDEEDDRPKGGYFDSE